MVHIMAIDRGFRPDLSEHLQRGVATFFERWAIEPVGTPVSTLDELRVKAAVWHGNRFNGHSETVSFVAEADRLGAFDVRQGRFYIGTIALSAIPPTQPEAIEAYADAARFSCMPDDKVDNYFHFMIDSLRALVGPEPAAAEAVELITVEH